MKTPAVVCKGAGGRLWLVLDPGEDPGPAWPGTPATAMCLETGEVREFHRPLSELIKYGWTQVAP